MTVVSKYRIAVMEFPMSRSTSLRSSPVDLSTDQGSRTSSIGREHDKETDLGFYGVRLYEPDYGRFLNTDVLWGLYRSVQPYQYSLNQPVSQIDAGGKWVEAKTPQAQEAVRNSVPSCFRDAVTFNKDGILNAGPLVEAAVGQDLESNVSRIASLAADAEGVTVEVLNPNDVQTYTTPEGGPHRVYETSFQFENNEVKGRTYPGKYFDGATDKISDTPFSTDENTRVVVNSHFEDQGATVAHEFVHVQLLFKHILGQAAEWRHQTPRNPKVEEKFERAESEAGK